jgi:phenylacetic acid degradation operon negative regulatory protein
MDAQAPQFDAAPATALPRGFEPLQARDLTLTLLGAYVWRRDVAVWSGGIVELLQEFGFSSGTARAALARLVQRELLSRARVGRAVCYRLTSRSEELLAEGDHRIFRLGRDHGPAQVWTVLWHWIPRERRLQRTRLARRLRFLGFGSVQDGMWLAPHDRTHEVEPLLEALDVEQFTGVIVGPPVGARDFPAFVRRAWDIDALPARYRTFVQEFSGYADERRGAVLDDRDAFIVRTRLTHTFRGFAFVDPDLPTEMVPELV